MHVYINQHLKVQIKHVQPLKLNKNIYNRLAIVTQDWRIDDVWTNYYNFVH